MCRSESSDKNFIPLNNMETKCYRASIGNIPNDQAKLRNSNIPLFFSVEFEKESEHTPVVTDPLVRCHKCKAYLNPYVEVIMPGIKWKCNLCEHINDLVSPFVMIERRNNEAQQDAIKNALFNRKHFVREDLKSDIYEIEAPDSFGVKTPDPPVLCFIIDVSTEANKLNILSSVLNCIKELLRNLEYDRRTRVCFIFYNEHAYILNNNHTMTVISGDIPMIMSESFTFSILDTENAFSSIKYEIIEKYFNDKKSPNSNILLPIKIAVQALRSASLFCFVSTVPNFGMSKIEPTTNFICKNNEYKIVAESLFRKNISANIFLMARYNIEYSTISVLAQHTGGQSFQYSNYDGYDPTSSSKLFCDLSDYFRKNIGFGGVCRIRASEGAVLRGAHGNFCQKSVDLLGYANWNPSHSINFSFTLFNNVKNALYVQLAMIRVTKSGSRFIRVFNICIPVHSDTFYDLCDSNAIAHSLVLEAFYYESRKKLGGGEFLQKSILSIWKEIKTKNGKIPDALAALPQLILSAKKSIPLRPDTATPTDFRSFYMYLFSNSHSKIIDLLLYPILLSLADSNVVPLNLSINSLTTTGIYILDTGINMFFYIGRECDQSFYGTLFEGLTSGPILFSPPENEFSNYVSELITYLIGDRSIKPRFILVNDAADSVYSAVFYSYLYDDKLHTLDNIDSYRRELEGVSQ